MTAGIKPLLEICVESFDDAMVAVRAGADRIEYCAALAVGGVTPSAGALARLRDVPVRCRVMIRPRPGDFIYGASDVAMMKHDIALARDHGAEGIVIGAAMQDGRLDRDMLADLLSVAGGLGATLHRVFDAVPDPFDALEGAIDLGFDRILTSGQQPTAEQGTGGSRSCPDRALRRKMRQNCCAQPGQRNCMPRAKKPSRRGVVTPPDGWRPMGRLCGGLRRGWRGLLRRKRDAI
jgi:copper homeostasis protein CutC